jgi:cobalt/nickel transport system ATP-binding protein
MNILEAQQITYIYPDGTKALCNIDLSIKKGSITALLGPNGAGKSTLFLHLNATLKPTTGKLYLKGEPFKYNKKALQQIRQTIGMVFQNPDDQLFAPTVYQDVAFGPNNLKLSKEEVKERVEESLRLVGMEDYADKPPHFLSGGQKKRVALAGVIAMQPEVIVLDEPTAGLDPHGQDTVIEIIEELNAHDTTIILSTHDVDLAANLADTIHILNSGQIITSGTPERVFTDPQLLKNSKLKMPTVIQTFRELKARGLSTGTDPITVLDLVESLKTPDILKVRCAIAHRKLTCGEKIGLTLKQGIMYTTEPNNGAMGEALYDAETGEDILIANITGDITPQTGNIHILQVPRLIEGGSRALNMDIIKKTLTQIEVDKIAAMGTSAKVLARKLNLHVDFDVDVIQSSMLAALRGLNVLILATGGMAKRACEKIKHTNQKNNTNIIYHLINTHTPP